LSSGRPEICGYDRLEIWNWRTGDLLAVRYRLAIYTVPGF